MLTHCRASKRIKFQSHGMNTLHGFEVLLSGAGSATFLSSDLNTEAAGFLLKTKHKNSVA
jgi:hypothetical protein